MKFVDWLYLGILFMAAVVMIAWLIDLFFFGQRQQGDRE